MTREEMIIDFYEDGKIPIIIKIIKKIFKENIYGNGNINKMDRIRNNTISNNGDNIIRNNKMY